MSQVATHTESRHAQALVISNGVCHCKCQQCYNQVYGTCVCDDCRCTATAQEGTE